MALEITGRLIQKLELQSGIGKTGSSWQKQEFVVETIEQYPKKICANLWGDKVDALAAVNIGDILVVSFAIESREFNGKWYTDVRAWKLEKQGVQAAQPEMPGVAPVAAPGIATPGVASPEPATSLPAEFETFTDEEGMRDDLPF